MVPIPAKRKSLEAMKVDHEITWVHPKMKFGDLAVGEKSKNYGLFLIPDIKRTRDVKGDRHVNIVVRYAKLFRKRRARTVEIERREFQDDYGNKYFEIDAKGIGAVLLGSTFKAPKAIKSGWGFYDGLLSEAEARKNRELSKKLLELGIRTTPSIAHIKLKELVNRRGQRVRVEDASINVREPIIELRAFGTRARVDDVFGQRGEQAKEILEEGIDSVRRELARPEMTEEEYLEWFAVTLGKNLARLNKNGLIQRHLSTHNLTLDARITDYSSIEEERRGINQTGDGRFLTVKLARAVNRLTETKLSRGRIREIANLFVEHYNKEIRS